MSQTVHSQISPETDLKPDHGETSTKEIIDDFLRTEGILPAKQACFSSNLRNPYKRPIRPEPQCFYQTTYGDIHPDWKLTGTMSLNNADIPTISEVMYMKGRSTVKPLLRAVVNDQRYTLINTYNRCEEERKGEQVLSAHVRPSRFPASADSLQYPPNMRRGGDNPLYATTQMDIGKYKPRPHQIPTHYFPKTNKFAKEFTYTHQRYAGLNTSATLSRVHKAFDEYY